LAKKVGDKHPAHGLYDEMSNRFFDRARQLLGMEEDMRVVDEPRGVIPIAEPTRPAAPRPRPTSTKPTLEKFQPTTVSLNPVRTILRNNELSPRSDEVHELAGFKKGIMRHQRLSEQQVQKLKNEHSLFWPRNAAKLQAAFLKNMNPENYNSPDAFAAAKERIKKMPPTDFAKVLAAIMSDEDQNQPK
jgi:hypothetical protein